MAAVEGESLWSKYLLQSKKHLLLKDVTIIELVIDHGVLLKILPFLCNDPTQLSHIGKSKLHRVSGTVFHKVFSECHTLFCIIRYLAKTIRIGHAKNHCHAII